ncbi:hypothetical protein [Stenotrophomonas sp. 364]|uniref:hypothetical protein n=1 Tax=Stenotrophomonas sp. 364 TaxID=2691571 RepID=UPI001317F4A5|nr:hypothetical protein [Stenotrophomonas sp. 364]QHB72923.1 hypothetical protein GQ674_17220 [Stenotrophomonas sp. 364]
MIGTDLALLAVLMVVALLNLGQSLVLASRHNTLQERIARLEAYQQTNLTHAETRAIYQRLSSMEGQIETTHTLLKTVQEHLLERDA